MQGTPGPFGYDCNLLGCCVNNCTSNTQHTVAQMPEANTGDVAQLVECLLRKHEVLGSPPRTATHSFGRKRQRQKDGKFKTIFSYKGTSRLDQSMRSHCQSKTQMPGTTSPPLTWKKSVQGATVKRTRKKWQSVPEQRATQV